MQINDVEDDVFCPGIVTLTEGYRKCDLSDCIHRLAIEAYQRLFWGPKARRRKAHSDISVEEQNICRTATINKDPSDFQTGYIS